MIQFPYGRLGVVGFMLMFVLAGTTFAGSVSEEYDDTPQAQNEITSYGCIRWDDSECPRVVPDTCVTHDEVVTCTGYENGVAVIVQYPK